MRRVRTRADVWGTFQDRRATTGEVRKRRKLLRKNYGNFGFKENGDLKDETSLNETADTGGEGINELQNLGSFTVDNIQLEPVNLKIEENVKKNKKKKRKISSFKITRGKNRSSFTMENDVYREKISNQIKLDRVVYQYRQQNYNYVIDEGLPLHSFFPDNKVLLYMLGDSFRILDQPEEVVKYLELLLNLDPNYNKQMYLYLAQALQKLRLYEEAVEILESGIDLYPLYYEINYLLAFILMKMKKFIGAISIYQDALKASPLDSKSRIGIADCYRFMKKYEKSAQYYQNALEYDESPKTAEDLHLKTALCYVEIKKWFKAENYIEQTLKLNPKNCEALYLKGLLFRLFYKEDEEAIKIYEKVCSLNFSIKATCRSLNDIALIDLENKDMYKCLHTLNRVEDEDIPRGMSSMKAFKVFANGAVSLIKKKYMEGIGLLSQALAMKKLGHDVLPKCLSFQAFGMFAAGKLHEACETYRHLDEKFGLSDVDNWNFFVCKGILKFKGRHYEDALSLFEDALSVSEADKFPIFYIWLCNIQLFLKENSKEFEQFLQEPKSPFSISFKKRLNILLLNSVEALKEVLQQYKRHTALLLTLSVIQTILNNPSAALSHLEQAIQECEHMDPKLFLWRGQVSAILGNTSQSVKDLKYCIHLYQNHEREAHNKFRKNVDVLEQTSKFDDKFISTQDLEQFFEQETCKSVTSDLEELNKINLTVEGQAKLALGFLFLKEKQLTRAMEVFEGYLKDPVTKPMVKTILGDFMLSNGFIDHAEKAYKEAFYSENLKNSKILDQSWRGLMSTLMIKGKLRELRGVLKFKEQDFRSKFDLKILGILLQAIGKKYEEALEDAESMVKEFERNEEFEGEGEDRFRGHFWGLSDLKFFLGVLNFQLNNFDLARKCFEEAKDDKYKYRYFFQEETKAIENMFEFKKIVGLLESKGKVATNQRYMYNLQTFTEQEVEYNIAVTFIMQGEYNKAKRILEKIDLPKNYKGNLRILVYELGTRDPDIDFHGGKTKQHIPFPQKMRLCSHFGRKTHHVKGGSNISLSLSFSYPGVFMPSMEDIVTPDSLKQLKFSFIGYDPKPPWQSKSGQYFTFTEQTKAETWKLTVAKNLSEILEISPNLDEQKIKAAMEKHRQRKAVGQFEENLTSQRSTFSKPNFNF